MIDDAAGTGDVDHAVKSSPAVIGR